MIACTVASYPSFPLDLYQIRSPARANDTILTDFGSTRGGANLRHLLARQFAGEGIAIGPDQILLTGSGTRAIDLICRFLLRPGDTVLRQAMARDEHDPVGLYFGTNTGSIFASSDEGDNWEEIVRHLPTILSVELLEHH